MGTGGEATGGTGEALCDNTCTYSYNFECEDGGPGASYAYCALGTDCYDCGTRYGTGGTGGYSTGGTGGFFTGGTGGVEGTLCSDTCIYSNDSWCDDGGPGSDTSICALGTDCTDCGPRDTATGGSGGTGGSSGGTGGSSGGTGGSSGGTGGSSGGTGGSSGGTGGTGGTGGEGGDAGSGAPEGGIGGDSAGSAGVVL